MVGVVYIIWRLVRLEVAQFLGEWRGDHLSGFQDSIGWHDRLPRASTTLIETLESFSDF